MSNETKPATMARMLRDVDATVQQAEKICQTLARAEVSIEDRQRQELERFLRAHIEFLLRIKAQAVASPNDSNCQLLVDCRQTMGESLQFVHNAFVAPRFLHTQQQYLEAADWMCVEGYRCYVRDHEGPIGPLVAIDSRRSPAVWDAQASLPMPTLFQLQPNCLARREQVHNESRTLAAFPVICLPEHVSRQPEYYPLLAHEVGHAVDGALGLTTQCLGLLSAMNHSYWEAWLREIVADVIGVMLAGRAFSVALESFTDFQLVELNNTPVSRYPGKALRLAIVRSIVCELSNTDVDRAALQAQTAQFDELGKKLFDQFQGELMRPVVNLCKPRDDALDWRHQDQLCADLAEQLVGCYQSRSKLSHSQQIPFRLLASSIALAQQRLPINEQSRFNTLRVFRELHRDYRQKFGEAPQWVNKPFVWQFADEVLANLRPTYLAADGRSKLPPIELMQRYDTLVYVGATNENLYEPLVKARGMGAKWKSIEVFFASPELLKQVEYYESTIEGEQRKAWPEVVKTQLKARQDIEQFLRQLADTQWRLCEFDGPPIFFSFSGPDAPGGRIHVSCQLLGTRIGQCPATDTLWTEEVPPFHYDAYRRHLEHLRSAARQIASSSTKAQLP